MEIPATVNGRIVEFQNGEGASKWHEIGTSGLEAFSGFIAEAFNAKLFWPGVEPEYERIRRSCPPIVMTRNIYTAQAGEQMVDVVVPEDATPADEGMADLFKSELENMEGGFEDWIGQYLSHVPFKGWGWWEVAAGIRSKNWRPPDPDDNWESEADDNLFGVRRLAWRDQSSFDSWDLTDNTGRLKGMWQSDFPNPRVLLPLNRSLHVTFGDNVNPEGLTPLEAVWRLEYIQRGYEVVFGIGSEHAAGYLDIRKTEAGELSAVDSDYIRRAAKSILTAQEGNYATWPFGFEGKVMDIPFSAAADILEAIRYYGLLMLQLYNMGHIAIATTAGTGAYSARESGASDFMFGFNSMVAGAIKQYDRQVGKMLYKWNLGAFPGARRPHYKARPLERLVGLGELAEFWQAITATMPVGDEDFITIRRKSGILSETLPEPEEIQNMPAPKDEKEPADDEEPDVEALEDGEDIEDIDEGDEDELAEMAVQSQEDYGDAVARLILRATDGRIQRPAFVKQMRELTTDQLLESFAAGAGIKVDDITDDQLTALLDDLEAHGESIDKLADDIYIGRIIE